MKEFINKWWNFGPGVSVVTKLKIYWGAAKFIAKNGWKPRD